MSRIGYVKNICDVCDRVLEVDDAIPTNWITIDIKRMEIEDVYIFSGEYGNYKVDFCDRDCFIKWAELIKQEGDI